ncbi:hypothetical protein LAZ67_17001234 [Cordylochernes scorpioides]|uniref:Uncharacterized protein n=1 Tax=Cordylochernes scorpioides TaxID=51811 RepID=A0ABY6LD84_9ARAC|nr:hypothetical protein LAZ67_17001234 [Cordylochernes scorpioides]
MLDEPRCQLYRAVVVEGDTAGPKELDPYHSMCIFMRLQDSETLTAAEIMPSKEFVHPAGPAEDPSLQVRGPPYDVEGLSDERPDGTEAPVTVAEGAVDGPAGRTGGADRGRMGRMGQGVEGQLEGRVGLVARRRSEAQSILDGGLMVGVHLARNLEMGVAARRERSRARRAERVVRPLRNGVAVPRSTTAAAKELDEGADSAPKPTAFSEVSLRQKAPRAAASARAERVGRAVRWSSTVRSRTRASAPAGGGQEVGRAEEPAAADDGEVQQLSSGDRRWLRPRMLEASSQSFSSRRRRGWRRVPSGGGWIQASPLLPPTSQLKAFLPPRVHTVVPPPRLRVGFPASTSEPQRSLIRRQIQGVLGTKGSRAKGGGGVLLERRTGLSKSEREGSVSNLAIELSVTPVGEWSTPWSQTIMAGARGLPMAARCMENASFLLAISANYRGRKGHFEPISSLALPNFLSAPAERDLYPLEAGELELGREVEKAEASDGNWPRHVVGGKPRRVVWPPDEPRQSGLQLGDSRGVVLDRGPHQRVRRSCSSDEGEAAGEGRPSAARSLQEGQEMLLPVGDGAPGGDVEPEDPDGGGRPGGAERGSRRGCARRRTRGQRSSGGSRQLRRPACILRRRSPPVRSLRRDEIGGRCRRRKR